MGVNIVLYCIVFAARWELIDISRVIRRSANSDRRGTFWHLQRIIVFDFVLVDIKT